MTRMPFGKWKDRLLTEIPDDYLRWFMDKQGHGWLKNAVEAELNRRAKKLEKDRDIFEWMEGK